MDVNGSVTVESGERYLERSMRSPWTVCWPSAIFRAAALAKAGGKREKDEPMADVPLLMRIACDWDFAHVSQPLAATRLHAEAATAALGSFTGAGYALDDQPRVLHGHRTRFLDEAALPKNRCSHYRALADTTYRRDKIGGLATRAGSGASWMSTSRTLAEYTRDDPRVLLLPTTWRLCAAQLGGRYAKRAGRRLLHLVP